MGSEYIGVKYYSDNDLSLGWNLEKSEEIIQSIDFYKTDNNINYILELYNVHLLIKSDARLTSWSDEHYNNIKIKSGSIKTMFFVIFSQSSIQNPKINF